MTSNKHLHTFRDLETITLTPPRNLETVSPFSSSCKIIKSLNSIHLPPPPALLDTSGVSTPPPSVHRHHQIPRDHSRTMTQYQPHRPLQSETRRALAADHDSNKENAGLQAYHQNYVPSHIGGMTLQGMQLTSLNNNNLPFYDHKFNINMLQMQDAGMLGTPKMVLKPGMQYYPAVPMQSGMSLNSNLNSDEIPKPEDMPPITDDGTKPPYSYATLIGMAILRSSNRQLTLSQIYSWINSTFKYYQRKSGWQNSIRHNLSLNKAFRKIERPKGDTGKGHYWVVEKGCEFQFIRVRTTKRPGNSTLATLGMIPNKVIEKHSNSTKVPVEGVHGSSLPDISHLQACAALREPAPKLTSSPLSISTDRFFRANTHKRGLSEVSPLALNKRHRASSTTLTASTSCHKPLLDTIPFLPPSSSIWMPLPTSATSEQFPHATSNTGGLSVPPPLQSPLRTTSSSLLLTLTPSSQHSDLTTSRFLSPPSSFKPLRLQHPQPLNTSNSGTSGGSGGSSGFNLLSSPTLNFEFDDFYYPLYSPSPSRSSAFPIFRDLDPLLEQSEQPQLKNEDTVGADMEKKHASQDNSGDSTEEEQEEQGERELSKEEKKAGITLEADLTAKGQALHKSLLV